jgi:transcriptional regulator with XRE-family HTH domain
MKEKNFRDIISRRLKACRLLKDLSLDAAAGATGVSKAMLGQIERKESVPTIALLWKIASGLNVSFSSFFADEVQPFSHQGLFPDDLDMKVSVIFPSNVETGMEMFEITLTNRHRQMSGPHRAGVIEHIVALKGNVRVFFNGEWHDLAPGDAARFYADQPHGYEAAGNTATFQNIICYT